MTTPMNRFQAIGNLTRDAELKYIPSGDAVLEFGVAVNERYQKDGEWKDGKTLFMDCQIWGAPGEKIARQMEKGVQVYVEGKLELDQWEDKETGAKRSKIRCRVFNSAVLVKPPKSEESSDEKKKPAQRQQSLSDAAGF